MADEPERDAVRHQAFCRAARALLDAGFREALKPSGPQLVVALPDDPLVRPMWLLHGRQGTIVVRGEWPTLLTLPVRATDDPPADAAVLVADETTPVSALLDLLRTPDARPVTCRVATLPYALHVLPDVVAHVAVRA